MGRHKRNRKNKANYEIREATSRIPEQRSIVCPDCAQPGYATRKLARRAAAARHDPAIREHRCPGEFGAWHLEWLPESQKHGHTGAEGC